MASFSYATAGTGKSAAAIGWFNFGPGFVLTPGTTITGLSAVYLDGSTVSFDISMSLISGTPMTVRAVTSPSYGGAAFGVAGYTGIPGEVILYCDSTPTPTDNRITISNISVKDKYGNNLNNYTLIAADGEATAPEEKLMFITNGTPWSLFTSIRNPLNPATTGIGTNTVNVIGVPGGPTPYGAPVIISNSPTQISCNIITISSAPREGFVFGFAITSVEVKKIINGRYSSLDQFNLEIIGPNVGTSGNVTTTGSYTGLQSASSQVFAFDGNTLAVTESMGVGSVGLLSNYISSVSWVNLTPFNPVPPAITPLGGSVALTLGDNIVATIINSLTLDFGDAPDGSPGTGPNDYNTLLLNNGPRHYIILGLTLGTLITSETDAHQNPTATGDDIGKSIQDDGLTTPVTLIVVGSTNYAVQATVTNNTGKIAYIYGWVDFNKNGIFELEEASLLTVVPSIPIGTQLITINFPIPNSSTLASGDITFMRLRLTTDALANSNSAQTQEDTRSLGIANDGEVEDYQVSAISLSVSGTVWYDKNCNGIQEPGEVVVEGATVKLYNSVDNSLVAVTTTDVNGKYLFNNLPTGSYYIKVELPLGYKSFTLPFIGTNPLIDSDVNSSTGISQTFTLSLNNQTEIIDAGLCNCVTVAGSAFYDCFSNSVLSAPDSKICGVKVSLLDSQGNVIQRATTDCDGNYEFPCVSSGIYSVKFVAPPSMNFVPQDTTTMGSKPDPNTGLAPIIISNMDILNVYAGFKGNFTVQPRYCNSNCDFN
ncbi:MAG: SdrD B-like domain-containing protein [Clostridium sp.]|uniref:CshA/CshB family fibrillar adhesin-related protein n=1 Tax=Anaerorhabdus sp. TaxID=1872524 RepID=UPI002FCA09FE